MNHAQITRYARSRDGSVIAYESLGSGEAVVLVDGAMCYRESGPMRPLAAQLSGALHVFLYDRRGRGESTDTLPYSPRKEVDDLEAVIDAAGGNARLYAVSSGVALALAAASSLGSKVSQLALYEPPFTDGSGVAAAAEYSSELTGLLAAGNRADAVALFLARVGMSHELIRNAKSSPGFSAMEALAPTLAYDDAQMGDSSLPLDAIDAVTQPAIVISGEASGPFLRNASERLAAAMRTAEFRSLPGQTHDADPEAIAPVIAEFFSR